MRPTTTATTTSIRQSSSFMFRIPKAGVIRNCRTGGGGGGSHKSHLSPKRWLASDTAVSSSASSSSSSSSSSTSTATTKNVYDDVHAQRRAYQYYYGSQSYSSSHTGWLRKLWNTMIQTIRSHLPRNNTIRTISPSSPPPQSRHDRHMVLATYLVAVVMGALGSTYASVPLYKMFCQATGFGGTPQRVQDGSDNNNTASSSISWMLQNALHQYTKWLRSSSTSIFSSIFSSSNGSNQTTRRIATGHGPNTWTDEDAARRLAELRPVPNAQLITIRMDGTVGDVLPWSFTPIQSHVKIVPGETALTFFRVTNHATHPIIGVATYNVHPPKMGLYFQKIQCFCFEEQRVLGGETVDMPVLFFIDPDILNDGQLSSITDMTLSYTFFPSDMDPDDDDEDDDDEEEEEVDAKEKDSQNGNDSKR